MPLEEDLLMAARCPEFPCVSSSPLLHGEHFRELRSMGMAYSLRLERTVDGNMAQDAEMLFPLRRNSGFAWWGSFAGGVDLLQKEVTLRSADTYVKDIRR
jgi:hypothetical protein